MHTHRTLTARAIGCVLALVLCAVASGQGLLDRLVPAEPTENAPSLALSIPLLSIASGGQPPEVPGGGPIPVEVVIGPGDFSGIVLITSQHDATQSVRVFAIATADPDVPTRVPLVLELDSRPYFWNSEVRVELHGADSAGDPVFRREVFDQHSVRSRRISGAQGVMPFSITSGTGLVGVFGQVGVPGRVQAGRDLRFVAVEPDGAPEVWRAYQSMDAIVVEERSLDAYAEGAVAALAEWLHAGGRMILIAEAEGRGRARLASALRQDPAWWRGIESAPPDTRGRGVTPVGEGFLLLHGDAGTRWARSRSGVSEAGSAVVGFGSVLVIEGDPDFPTFSISAPDATGVFELDDHVSRRAIAWLGYQTSRSAVSMAWLTDTVLDQELDPGRAGSNLMIGVCVLVLLLALMMGPFDRFVLKKKGLGSISWATAVLWLLLASILAAIGPRYVRSGDDTLTRVGAIDLIATERGSEGWSVGTNGVFAGRRIAYTPTAEPGSWWRGVSASDADNEVFSPMTLAQGQGISPGGMTPMGGSDGHAIEQAQWTFRLFEDRSKARSRLTGAFEIDASGEETVTVRGLPEGAVIRGATVHGDGTRQVIAIDFEGDGPTRRAAVDPSVSPDQRLRDRLVSASTLVDVGFRTPSIGWMLWSEAYALITLDIEGWPMERPRGFGGEVKSVAVVRLVVPIVRHQSAGPAGDGGETP